MQSLSGPQSLGAGFLDLGKFGNRRDGFPKFQELRQTVISQILKRSFRRREGDLVCKVCQAPSLRERNFWT